jgi:hypothetical protein
MATTGEQFDRYCRENPHVLSVLTGLARQWRAAHPGKRVGIDAIFGAARWSVMMTTSDTEYKLRNDFKPFYARLIMHRHADLAGVFELRSAQEPDNWLAELVGLGQQ